MELTQRDRDTLTLIGRSRATYVSALTAEQARAKKMADRQGRWAVSKTEAAFTLYARAGRAKQAHVQERLKRQAERMRLEASNHKAHHEAFICIAEAARLCLERA